MRRDEAMRRLRSLEPELRRRGVTALFLFGSTGRDEASEQSDLDVFIEYDRSQPFSLFDRISVQHFLSDRLRRPVDLSTRWSLHPAMAGDILRDARKVF